MQQKLSAFRQLNIIHKALLAGQIIFAAVAAYLFYSGVEQPQMKEYDRIFQVIAIAVAAAGFFAGTVIFKKMVSTAKDAAVSTKEKFARYRSACVLQWALLEGPCLFSIVFFYLTANYAFIALAGVLIGLFIVLSPNKIKIAWQLGISENDVSEL